jgi:hypothetical protein
MPSPSVSTVPVSATEGAPSMFWICFLMICEISSARSCMLSSGCAVAEWEGEAYDGLAAGRAATRE